MSLGFFQKGHKISKTVNYHGWPRKKMSDFWTGWHGQIRHSNPRTFHLDESWKATQTYLYPQIQMPIFTCKQIWKMYPGKSIHDKIWLSRLQCKVVLVYFRWLVFLIYFIWIVKNQLFNISSICFRYPQKSDQQVDKKITIYKEFLGTCIKSRKQHLYSMYPLKILQTSCFTTFGSLTYQEKLFWNVHLPRLPK